MRYDDLQRQLGETNAAIGQVNGQSIRLDDQAHLRRSAGSIGTPSSSTRRKRSLQLHDALLKRRLVDIYEYGDLGYVNVLISARSFSEFVERWEDLRLLIAANERTVRARKAAEARVATIEADLERTRLELQHRSRPKRRRAASSTRWPSERRNLVELTGAQRHSVASQVAEIEDLSAAEEVAARRADPRARAGAGGAAPGGRHRRRRRESRAARRTFSWPVTGTITSPFGWRSNPSAARPSSIRASTSRRPAGRRSRRPPAAPSSWRNGTADTATTS